MWHCARAVSQSDTQINYILNCFNNSCWSIVIDVVEETIIQKCIYTKCVTFRYTRQNKHKNRDAPQCQSSPGPLRVIHNLTLADQQRRDVNAHFAVCITIYNCVHKIPRTIDHILDCVQVINRALTTLELYHASQFCTYVGMCSIN